MLNTLKILSLNYLNDIAIYDYKKTLIYTDNNTLNYYINNLLNNNYDYFITIDYSNNQLNIDLYKKNTNDILFNINIDLYYNKDAFNLFIDAILNKDNNLNYNFNYSIIKINKYALTF